jgi:type 1 glutamine amidotransferase
MQHFSGICLLGLGFSVALAAACSGGTEQVGLIKGLATAGDGSGLSQGGSVASDAGNGSIAGAPPLGSAGTPSDQGGGTSGGATGATGGSATGGANTGGATPSGGTGTGGGAVAGGAGGGTAGPINVLLFNYTTTYGHQSRETAIPLLKKAGDANGINFDTKSALTAVQGEGKTDSSLNLKPDMSTFSDAGLEAYDVVFFLNTTGDALSSDGAAKETAYKQALQDFLEKKHRGFVGTHSATDTFHSAALWQWYMDMIGAKFVNHSSYPTQGSASIKQGVTHPILTQSGVPNPWSRSEEWYTLDRDPTNVAGVTVLLIAHDSAFPDRPTAWVHDMPGGGRVFYTAFGHDVSAFNEPQFMKFLIAGVKWAGHGL